MSTKFRDQHWNHLAKYKRDALGIAEDGIYRYRGRDILKAHILPIELRETNILEEYRLQFYASEYSHIKYHRFFHHLNSSQALCINLFYPLIAEAQVALFPEYLGFTSLSPGSEMFEKESDIEAGGGRRTSFDFYLETLEASRVFVEVKYTEDGFARAKNDDAHRTKFRKTYLPLLRKKPPYLVPECQDVEFFLRHYQVLRNLVHIGETAHVVFLFPSTNSKVADQAINTRDRFLTDLGRERFRIVFLEEFVSFLEDKSSGTPLAGYYQAFRAKYLPGTGASTKGEA